MPTEKNILIEKTLHLLEYGTIMDRAALCAMSAEAAEMIRREKPLLDPLQVRETKDAVRAVLARIDSGDTEPRSSLPAIGFLLPKLAV